MSEWPKYKLAWELAGDVFPVSEAVILDIARKHGIGRRFGRVIIWTPPKTPKMVAWAGAKSLICLDPF